MKECPVCGNRVDNVAIVELLYTWEPFPAQCDGERNELREVAWHRECYTAALEAELAQHHRQEQTWKHGLWIDPILYEGVRAELAQVKAERDALVAWKTLACKIHGSGHGEDLDAIVSRRL